MSLRRVLRAGSALIAQRVRPTSTRLALTFYLFDEHESASCMLPNYAVSLTPCLHFVCRVCPKYQVARLLPMPLDLVSSLIRVIKDRGSTVRDLLTMEIQSSRSRSPQRDTTRGVR